MDEPESLRWRVGTRIDGRFEIIGGLYLSDGDYDDMDRKRSFSQCQSHDSATTPADERRCSVAHEGWTRVLGFGEWDDKSYLVAEDIAGEPLEDVLLAAQARGEYVPESFVLKAVSDLLLILDAVHSKNDLVHGDVCTGSTFVSDGKVKILCIGLSKSLHQSFTDVLPYMSPEQVRAEAVDARTDVWAVGVMMFRMFTGRFPFLRSPHRDLREAILTAQVPRVRDINPEVSSFAEDVIQRALEKQPNARYRSAIEMLQDIVRGASPIEAAQINPSSITHSIADNQRQNPDIQQAFMSPRREAVSLRAPEAASAPRQESGQSNVMPRQEGLSRLSQAGFALKPLVSSPNRSTEPWREDQGPLSARSVPHPAAQERAQPGAPAPAPAPTPREARAPGSVGLVVTRDVPHTVLEVLDVSDVEGTLQGQAGYQNIDILPGDRLLAVNNVAAEMLPIQVVHELLRGPSGTVVNLQLGRGHKTFEPQPQQHLMTPRPPPKMQSLDPVPQDNGPLRVSKRAGMGSFTSITSAVSRAAAGSTIVVDGGLYEEEIVLDRPVSIVCDGNDRVVLQGSHGRPLLKCFADNVSISGMAMNQTGGDSTRRGKETVRAVECFRGSLNLHNCSVWSDRGIAVMVAENGVLVAEGCNLCGSGKCAILATDNGNARCESCEVNRNRMYGVVCQSGGKGVVSKSQVCNNGAVGVLAHRTGAECILTESEISDNGEMGVAVQDGAQVNLEKNRVARNRHAGLYADGHGAYASAWKTEFLDNGVRGVGVQGGACVEAVECTMSGNRQEGVFVSGKSSRSLLQQNEISSNGSKGVGIQSGGFVLIKGNQIRKNEEGGVFVCDPETLTTIKDNLLSENRMRGVGVQLGATAEIENNRICNNTAEGVYVSRPGSRALITKNVIAGNGVKGVGVQYGADASIEDNEIYENKMVGVHVDHAGSRATLRYNNIKGQSVSIAAEEGALVKSIGNNVVDTSSSSAMETVMEEEEVDTGEPRGADAMFESPQKGERSKMEFPMADEGSRVMTPREDPSYKSLLTPREVPTPRTMTLPRAFPSRLDAIINEQINWPSKVTPSSVNLSSPPSSSSSSKGSGVPEASTKHSQDKDVPARNASLRGRLTTPATNGGADRPNIVPTLKLTGLQNNRGVDPRKEQETVPAPRGTAAPDSSGGVNNQPGKISTPRVLETGPVETGAGGGEAKPSFKDWVLMPTYSNTPRTTRTTLPDNGLETDKVANSPRIV
ncbi:hypothetical protein GUITHDRAFT_122649 [Guillardia theta CCMP2712]|uniref:Protein kinase domain-containing protein n=1 Tax=Guillardia theta (strain CCMP2712) TaxID=905079 RepID=L1I4E6_GUITC|nr:hypothetical protein GUITHDRAFT_122649 [Guillardia theta CCMP2712]EKX31148.1 hypothetical protein GUITHDRAFT_122649 [Guillardia theta CCMP2712]|eukprot:XP_005818128.1 hypothetical protein GUITHDRAFT_122649 [Guillardia theta CCMP2712]